MQLLKSVVARSETANLNNVDSKATGEHLEILQTTNVDQVSMLLGLAGLFCLGFKLTLAFLPMGVIEPTTPFPLNTREVLSHHLQTFIREKRTLRLKRVRHTPGPPP